MLDLLDIFRTPIANNTTRVNFTQIHSIRSQIFRYLTSQMSDISLSACRVSSFSAPSKGEADELIQDAMFEDLN